MRNLELVNFKCVTYAQPIPVVLKGGRMGRSDKVSLWCVSLLINTRFRFFILE